MEAITGDCREVLSDRFEPNYFHSVVCDPPYGLEFMGKEWDHRIPGKEFWLEIKRVLKPGGFLLAFGGTRTSHRLAVAIEDAGFEIRDSIVWIFGSGFPKSLDISKGIDRKFGAVRDLVGMKKVSRDLARNGCKGDEAISPVPVVGTSVSITSASTALAQEWDGWGTGIKPSHEPILLCRKPLSEKTVVENVLKHRTGGINIDGGRIEIDFDCGGRESSKNTVQKTSGIGFEGSQKDSQETLLYNSQGRWPANVILGHSEGCEEEQCVKDCPVKELDGQTEELLSGGAQRGSVIRSKGKGLVFGKFGACEKTTGLAFDSGGASRFFYQAKAGRKERYFLCKTCDQVDNNREKHEDHDIAFHPTQKPLQLLRYLIRLVTPIEGLVLDPFMGTGTTLLAAKLEGFNGVGIDKEPDYVRITNHRLGITDQEPLKRLVYHDKPKVVISLNGKQLNTTGAF